MANTQGPSVSGRKGKRGRSEKLGQPLAGPRAERWRGSERPGRWGKKDRRTRLGRRWKKKEKEGKVGRRGRKEKEEAAWADWAGLGFSISFLFLFLFQIFFKPA